MRYALVETQAGPALTREIYVKNTSARPLTANLWTYFNLHGTQRFVYNKELWYDCGLPLTGRETVVAATVPYSDILQIKRVSSVTRAARPVEATCDYSSFVGDTGASATLPQAVCAGGLLPGGAGGRPKTGSEDRHDFAGRHRAGTKTRGMEHLAYRNRFGHRRGVHRDEAAHAAVVEVGHVNHAVFSHSQTGRITELGLGRRTVVTTETGSSGTGNRLNHAVLRDFTNPMVVRVSNEQVAFDTIRDALRFPETANLHGLVGSGKTFLAWAFSRTDCS